MEFSPTSANVPESQKLWVDLRSDTVSRPTQQMIDAMAKAMVGDDVLGDDPTVAELEALAAKMLGKESAVFVPSGTMGNQIAVATHTSPGDAMLIEEDAHILYYECGAPGVISSIVSWTLPSDKGILDPNVIDAHAKKRSLHTPGTVLLCLENTHNRAGGTVIPPQTMADYRTVADKHGMKIHLDGARVFNAAVALGKPVSEIAKHCDTVNFCLSKGLGAPVGSLLVGPAEFIERARMWRKRLGGGMRQSGFLAACGILSLTTMVDRLADDHRRARQLASALDGVPGLTVDWDRVQTNMVLIETDGPSAPWLEALRERNIHALPPAENRIRCVFHHDIDDEKTERAAEAFRSVASLVAR